MAAPLAPQERPSAERPAQGRQAPAASPAAQENRVSDQQVMSYIVNRILPALEKKHGAKFTVDQVRRSPKNQRRFEVSGKAFSASGTPLKSVSFLMESLSDSPCFSQVNLDRAGRKSAGGQDFFEYTFSLAADPIPELANIKLKPEAFEFVVPVQPGSSGPEAMYLVKILKKNADSESTVFEMPKKAGDKVILSVMPEAGSSLVVLIDGNRVYEKKY